MPLLQLKLPDVEEDLLPQMDLSQDFALLDEDGRAGDNVSTLTPLLRKEVKQFSRLQSVHAPRRGCCGS